MKTWIITGCSSGLRPSLAQAVLESGYNAVVTARNPQVLENLVSSFPQTSVATAFDVMKPDQVAGAIKSPNNVLVGWMFWLTMRGSR